MKQPASLAAAVLWFYAGRAIYSFFRGWLGLLAEECRRRICREDRISQLPDDIIHTIVSRLKSPGEAARTSLLSRRWLHLWRSYPFVNFNLSKENQCQFRSFVTSTYRRLLLPSNLDHSSSSSCTAVAAIQGFCISAYHDFQKEDLDQLLSLFTTANGLSPAKFLLSCKESHPCYSLQVPNWSRTRIISLAGCDLTPTTNFGVPDNRNVVSLSSLEVLCLRNVSLSEVLLHSFLANAPRLSSLCLSEVYGIDRLEVVSSPCLISLGLFNIYRVGRPGPDQMRRLRIASPKLQHLMMGLSLEELEIDAPNLLSLSGRISLGDPLTKVNVVNLASNCESSIHVIARLSPRWLRRVLSTTFTKFHHLNLVFSSFLSSPQQGPLDLSQAECASPPPLIDQVRYEPSWRGICDIEDAAAFSVRLFLCCRPRLMSITKRECQDLIAEYMCQEYLSTDSPDGENAAVSWRHHLKDMKIENDTTGEMMEISEDVIPSLAKREKIRFMLTWC